MALELKRRWMKFVEVLARVQTVVLLGIIYHIAVGPIGLLARAFRKDLLGLRRPPGETYAVEIGRLSTTRERAQRQF